MWEATAAGGGGGTACLPPALLIIGGFPLCYRWFPVAAADPPRPFDFLIHEELLRLSLHKHLLAKQISTVRRCLPARPPACLPTSFSHRLPACPPPSHIHCLPF